MTIRLISYLFLVLVLAACSHVNSTQPTPAKPTATQQNRDRRPITQPAATPTPVAHQHHIAIAPGDPQRGIDTYEAELRKHPHDEVLTRDYVKNLEKLRTSADQAFEHSNVAQAGRIYTVLLRNYHRFGDVSKGLSFTTGYLNTRLAYCKKTLSRRGFEEYRKGNLKEAIDYWEDYLAIDPNSQDIKKALQTASVQQKNLQSGR